MRIKPRFPFALLSVLSLMCALCLSVMKAQTVTGSVTGEVTDASGAVIPNASVMVENADTGVQTTTPTNAQGVYSVRFLPIGRYRVVVSAPETEPA